MIHFYERPDIPMLFDLTDDRGEVHNIASENRQEHEQLHQQLFGYLKRVNARIPMLNPDYDPAVYAKSKEYGKRMAWGPFVGSRPVEADEVMGSF